MFIKENKIEEPFSHMYNMANQFLTDYGDFRLLKNARYLTSAILQKLKLCVQSSFETLIPKTNVTFFKVKRSYSNNFDTR